MSTILYPSPIFGPVHSRRLGVSLGINLLPPDGKVCTFDCLYCECGFNATHRPHNQLPSREAVRKALEECLSRMLANGETPDVLTFAGNGEPTAHPEFSGIVDDTLALRNRYFPHAKVSVLSNATLIDRDAVMEALLKVDNNILKLDTVNPDYIHRVDRPTAAYDVAALLTFLILVNQFSRPVSSIAQQLNIVMLALAGAERIFDLMDEKPEKDEGYVHLVNAKIDENGKEILVRPKFIMLAFVEWMMMATFFFDLLLMLILSIKM